MRTPKQIFNDVQEDCNKIYIQSPSLENIVAMAIEEGQKELFYCIYDKLEALPEDLFEKLDKDFNTDINLLLCI